MFVTLYLQRGIFNNNKNAINVNKILFLGRVMQLTIPLFFIMFKVGFPCLDFFLCEFSFFEDWLEKYEHIIELGKSLPKIDESHKQDPNLIKGCQSKVWLHARYTDEKVVFSADSDAIITKGIVALLLRVFNLSFVFKQIFL